MITSAHDTHLYLPRAINTETAFTKLYLQQIGKQLHVHRKNLTLHDVISSVLHVHRGGKKELPQVGYSQTASYV